MLKMDGYDDCKAGVCQRFGQADIIIYNKEKVIDKLMEEMSYEEAEEFFQFNMLGAWVGDTTPAFLIPCDEHGCMSYYEENVEDMEDHVS